jgi:hypothetical protein
MTNRNSRIARERYENVGEIGETLTRTRVGIYNTTAGTADCTYSNFFAFVCISKY